MGPFRYGRWVITFRNVPPANRLSWPRWWIAMTPEASHLWASSTFGSCRRYAELEPLDDALAPGWPTLPWTEAQARAVTLAALTALIEALQSESITANSDEPPQLEAWVDEVTEGT
jgi:hypothetical protein